MNESLKDRLFREPEGASTGLLWISFGIFCFYFERITESGSSFWLLLGSLLILVAIPEFLPPEYTYVAGLLRIIIITVAILAVLFSVLVF